MGSSVILPSPGQPLPMKEGEFVSQTRARIVRFAHENLSPPSPLYVTSEEQIILQVTNSVPGAALKVSWRLLFPDGFLSHAELVFTPTSDRVVNRFEIPLQEGFLLALHLSTTGVSTPRGRFFVSAGIEVGKAPAGAFVQALFNDYVDSTFQFGWPGGALSQSVQGNGALLSVQTAAPAAGADTSTTVPTGARWLLRSWTAQLVVSAAVATRTVEFAFTDGVNGFLRAVSTINQTAGQTIRYTMANGLTVTANDAANTQITIPSDVRLIAGWKILTVTTNLQAGDQWGAQQMEVEEWLEQ